MRTLIMIPILLTFFACNQSKRKDKEAEIKDSSKTTMDTVKAESKKPEITMLPAEDSINKMVKTEYGDAWHILFFPL